MYFVLDEIGPLALQAPSSITRVPLWDSSGKQR